MDIAGLTGLNSFPCSVDLTPLHNKRPQQGSNNMHLYGSGGSGRRTSFCNLEMHREVCNALEEQ